MIIGNDIIDLEIALDKPRRNNDRFLSKVFSDNEISQIHSYSNPELAIWKIWSMKEAAYKAHQRLFQIPARLDPVSYECDLDKLSVSKNHNLYIIKSVHDENHIYSWLEFKNLDHVKLSYSTNYMSEFLKEFSIRTGHDFQNIELRKNKIGIPEVFLKNTGTSLPISITHHGRFAAICFPLINC
ncbi:4'-phosphopantetheinyl transferase superfamily protein [Christiangramia sp. LLG6405-1]|uniref:4'-phosphopantetheinyl transferase superfamily protein n=1 Tax=Christiangramia sp. LLG6405-1 TaxID=3160832 RepID=UPI003868F0A7